VFTARYALSPYIKQIRFVFKGLNFILRVHPQYSSSQPRLPYFHFVRFVVCLKALTRFSQSQLHSHKYVCFVVDIWIFWKRDFRKLHTACVRAITSGLFWIKSFVSKQNSKIIVYGDINLFI
jgi:hypothetical protein